MIPSRSKLKTTQNVKRILSRALGLKRNDVTRSGCELKRNDKINDTSVDPNRDAIDLCDKNKSVTKKGNNSELSTGWLFGCLTPSLVA